MLLPADMTFRREEVSELLGLNPAVIDALFVSRTLEGDAIAAVGSGAVLSRFAPAAVSGAGDARRCSSGAGGQPGHGSGDRDRGAACGGDAGARVPIVRTSEEELSDAEQRPNLRAGVRYVPRRQIGGVFRDVKFVMLQLSSSGLRIRHDEALHPGDEARLSFAILNPPKSFVMRARVVWTSIAQRGDERSYYISGLRVVENTDRLVNAAYLLRTARELQIDDRDIGRTLPNPRSASRKMPRHVNGLSDEDVVAIIQAVRKLPTIHRKRRAGMHERASRLRMKKCARRLPAERASAKRWSASGSTSSAAPI